MVLRTGTTPGNGLTRLGRTENAAAKQGDDSAAPRSQPTSHAPTPAPQARKPRRAMSAALLLLIVGAVGFAIWGMLPKVVGLAIAEAETVAVAAPADVRVAEVFVRPGVYVEAGEPLVRLEAIGVAAERAALVAEIEQAEARLELAKAGADVTEVPLTRRLDTQNDLAANAEAAQADQVVASVALKLAQARVSRLEQMLGRRAASQQELDDAYETQARARGEHDAATARLNAAQKRLERQSILIPADTSVSKIRNLELDMLTAPVRQAKARLQQFDHEVGTRTITAPYTARIDRVFVQAGGVRNESETLLTLFNPKTTRLLAYVKPKNAKSLEVGGDITMVPVGEMGNVMRGRVVARHVGWSRVPEELAERYPDELRLITFEIECAGCGIAPQMYLNVMSPQRGFVDGILDRLPF